MYKSTDYTINARSTPGLWPIPVTFNNFRYNTDLWRRRYVRFNTILWNTLEYTIITRSYTQAYTGHN